jgi:hypothetical protein
LDENSTLPTLTNNRVEYGFPGFMVLALKYFLVKDKRNRSAGQQPVAPPSQPSPYWHNNKEDYKQPTALWGVICITGNGNVKEACEALVWDMVDMGLQVWWKDHQLAESRAQVLLINVPLVLDRGGVEGEIIWHLMEIEKVSWRKEFFHQSMMASSYPRLGWLGNRTNKGKGKIKWIRTSLWTSYLPFKKTVVSSILWRPQRAPGQDWALSGKLSTKRGYAGGHLGAPALWL